MKYAIVLAALVLFGCASAPHVSHPAPSPSDDPVVLTDCPFADDPAACIPMTCRDLHNMIKNINDMKHDKQMRKYVDFAAYKPYVDFAKTHCADKPTPGPSPGADLTGEK